MSTKKLLIISPTPTHPQNAGNRKRIYNLAASLKMLGYEVHFLYVGQEEVDKEAMNNYWGNKAYYFCSGKRHPNLPRLNIVKRFYCSFKYSPEEIKYNFHIDDWYENVLDRFITDLQEEERFDTVIVEYIFLSKVLLNFEVNVLKILDTHDIFTNRFEKYLKNSQRPQWFSTYENEEAKALNRADIIIAIQKHEKDYFSHISRSRVIQIGHILSWCYREKTEFEKKILFVASHNPINVDGINFFVNEVLSKLRVKYPDVQLVVAGKICNLINEGDNIVLVGEFEDPQQVYKEADIVINPVRFGTGLNVKTIEALSYGKPLVATTAGTAGLEHIRNKAFLVADTDLEFVEALSNLMDSESRCQSLIKNAKDFIDNYSHNNLQELKKMLN